MKKIIFISYSMSGGGAEKVCYLIANELNKNSLFSIDLVLFKKEGEYLKEIDPSIKIHMLSPVLLKFALIGKILALAKIFRTIKPDIIVSFAEWPNTISSFAKRISVPNAKLFINEQNTNTFINNYKLYRVSWITHCLAKKSYMTANTIICCSKAVENSVLESLKKKVTKVIYNPVDIDLAKLKSKEFLSHPFLDQKNIILTAIGRFHPQKDYETMIKAFSIAYKLNQNIRLFILGTGNLKSNIENLTIQLKCSDAISFEGFQDNPYKYLVRSDTLIHSAIFEGFGNIFIESLSSGTPVVTTDCNTPKEILENSLQGTIVPVGDINTLSDAILKVKKKTTTISAICMTRAMDFNLPKIAKEYQEVFNANCLK